MYDKPSSVRLWLEMLETHRQNRLFWDGKGGKIVSFLCGHPVLEEEFNSPRLVDVIKYTKIG